MTREERDLVDAARGALGFSEFARPAVLAAAQFSTQQTLQAGVPVVAPTSATGSVVVPMLTDPDRIELKRCAAGMTGAGGLLNQLIREMNIRRQAGETPPLDIERLSELMTTLRDLAGEVRALLDRADGRASVRLRRRSPAPVPSLKAVGGT